MGGSTLYQTWYPDLANTPITNGANASWSINNKSTSDQKTRSRYQEGKSLSTVNKKAKKGIIQVYQENNKEKSKER